MIIENYDLVITKKNVESLYIYIFTDNILIVVY